jgi:succinate dehydrogenase/fumarate reductase iron-sulfur protein
MNIKVLDKTYEIEQNVNTILDALNFIKENQNQDLNFRSSCKSGVCGSCAVVVNGVETLACTKSCSQHDEVGPLKNTKIIRDLVVDLDHEDKLLERSSSFLLEKSDETILSADEKLIDKESNCILCHSCYSSCPVYEVNENFLGPFALARSYRYVSDKKENEQKQHIDAVQDNGIWDCTLCGNCNMVCPAHIDIKNDILQLRNKSAQFGYMDPSFSSGGGFNAGGAPDFGFNPNF